MKCFNCGGTMTTKRENAPYAALPGTVLAGVEVSRCRKCGEYEVAIPAIDELNRALAKSVIETPRRLNGPEIRFLRTYLGYSSVDFAKMLGIAAESVSRWESGAQDIGRQADLLVRALVMIDKKVDEYPIKAFEGLSGDVVDPPQKGTLLRAFKPSAKKWTATDLTA